jgi:hypothetical protein
LALTGSITSVWPLGISTSPLPTPGGFQSIRTRIGASNSFFRSATIFRFIVPACTSGIFGCSMRSV